MIDLGTPKPASNVHAGCVFAVVTFCAILLGLGLKVVSSHFEAAAYNRATGSDVSTWDAMWIELRVQAEPKSGGGK